MRRSTPSLASVVAALAFAACEAKSPRPENAPAAPATLAASVVSRAPQGKRADTIVDLAWSDSELIGVRYDGAITGLTGSTSMHVREMPGDGEKFKRLAARPNSGTTVAVTDRGHLYRVGFGDLGVRVQAGSLLAASSEGFWIAGEAGGLSRLDLATRSLTEVVPTGNAPATALAATKGRVVVGRADGTLFSTDGSTESRPARPEPAPIAAVLLDDEVGIAVADTTGRVDWRKPGSADWTTWSAGGTVAALVAMPAAPDLGGRALPLAVREDGEIVAPDSGGGPEARTIVSSGSKIWTAIGIADDPGSMRVFAAGATSPLMVLVVRWTRAGSDSR